MIEIKKHLANEQSFTKGNHRILVHNKPSSKMIARPELPS